MPKQVLVPLDDTELALSILPCVTQLARAHGGGLVLLTVVEQAASKGPAGEAVGTTPRGKATAARGAGLSPAPVSQVLLEAVRSRCEPAEAGVDSGLALQARIQEAALRLKEVALRLVGEGIESRPVVTVGPVADEVLRVAADEGCDLIAMATHGRGAIGRAVLGSVTDKVIRASQVPVLAITTEAAERCRRDGAALGTVLVPLDGSPLSETALPVAEELAGTMPLEMLLVRVIDTGSPYAGVWDDAGYVPPDPEIKAEGREYLAGVARKLRGRGLSVRWELLKGPPALSIVQLARETPRSLVALTTHARSGLVRWWLGSVAEAVVRSSGAPVLVVPPPA